MRKNYKTYFSLFVCLLVQLGVQAQEIVLEKVKKADYFYSQLSVDGGNSTVSTDVNSAEYSVPVRVIYYYYDNVGRISRMVESDIMLGDSPETLEIESEGQEIPRTYTQYNYDDHGLLQKVRTRSYVYQSSAYGVRTWGDFSDSEVYEYDTNGKLVKKTDVSYIMTYKWDGDNMVEETANYVKNGEWSYTIQYSNFVEGEKNLPQYGVRSDKWGVKYGSGDLILEYVYENGLKVKCSEYKVSDIVRDENNIITSSTKGNLYRELTWTYADGILSEEFIGFWNSGNSTIVPSSKVVYTLQNDSIYTRAYTYNSSKETWAGTGTPKVSVMGLNDVTTSPSDFTVTANTSSVNTVKLSATIPADAATDGWNVYRNGMLIGSAQASNGKLNYTDANVPNGTYDYFIQHGDANTSEVVECIFDTPLAAVENFFVVKNGKNKSTKQVELYVQWDAPASDVEILGYNIYLDPTTGKIEEPLNGEQLVRTTAYKLDFVDNVNIVLNHTIVVEAVYAIGRVSSEAFGVKLVKTVLPETVSKTMCVMTMGDVMGGLVADNQPAKAHVNYYDAENKLIRSIHYSYVTAVASDMPDTFFQPGDWKPFQYFSYEYNELNQLVAINQRDYGVYSGYNEAWEEFENVECCVYYEDGRLAKDSVKGRWYVYTYEGDNLVKEVYQTAYGNTVYEKTFSNFVSGKKNLPQYAFMSGITSSNNRIYEYKYDADGNMISTYTYKHDSETIVKDENGNVISAEKGVPEFEEIWTYVEGELTKYEKNKWNTKEETFLPNSKTEYAQTALGLQATSYTYSVGIWAKSGCPQVTRTVAFDGVAPTNLVVTDVEGKLNTVLLTADAPENATSSTVWNVFRDGVIIGQATLENGKLTYTDSLVSNGAKDYFIQAADPHNPMLGVNISNAVTKRFDYTLPAVTEVRVEKNGVNSVGDYSLKLSWDAPVLTEAHADLQILGYNMFQDIKEMTKNPSPVNGIYYFEGENYTLEFANTTNREKTFCVETVYNIGKIKGVTLPVTLSNEKLPDETGSSVETVKTVDKLTWDGHSLVITGDYLSLEVYTVNGVCVATCSAVPTLNLALLPNGVYVAHLKTLDGIATVKIIKK